MKLIKGDLLEGEWDFACHVCNSYTTMGSGVAYFLKKKWPQVYEADVENDRLHFLDGNDPDEKLGTFSIAELNDYRAVYNLYAMCGIGNGGHPLDRNCRYDALFDALFTMCEDIVSKNQLIGKICIGIPYLMGCCRAGGSWRIVEAILNEIEYIYDNIEFIVYQIDEAELTAQSTQPIPIHKDA